MKKIKTLEQVKQVLDSIVADYVNEVSEFINKNGEIDWGNKVIGYDSEEELIQDILDYVSGQE